MKLYIKTALLMVIVFGIFFGIGAGLGQMFKPDDKTTLAEESNVTTVQDKERTNILLLGVDAREGDSTTSARSDTIILASIDPQQKRVAVVSIPRDTKVNGSANGGFDKINAANVVGGPEMAVEKVEELMGEKIDYYMEIDFEGFKNIIDTLGGVTINVDQRMYKPSEDIDLKPGIQELDGSDALAFVRFRDYLNGDIDRTAHQQEFLKALGKELLQPSTLVKLPTLITEAKAHVKTDLSLADMFKIASWAPGFSSDSIIAQTLPGSFYDQRNEQGVLTASYWIADKTVVSTLLDKMLSGQTVAVIVPGSVHQTTTTGSSKTSTDTQNQTDTDKIKQERSNLPSAGHGAKI
ncbi:MAG: LCP family protein [Syntrophomonadaceae bacterium]|nr:LCP family protein [Syntrophomonadaceae bacterium]